MSNSIFKMCPFCGRREVVHIETTEDWFHNDKYKVVCGDDDFGCGASSAWFYSEDEAVDAWNRRAIE